MKNSTTKRRFDSGYGGWSVASRCLLCLAFLLAGTSVWAQTHRLTGRVTDDKDQAVVGASVIVKGTTQGITTDSDGNFTLDLPNGDATLVVSFIGYRTQEVPVIRSQSRVNVELAPESIAVDEVVVVGYGEQSRRSVTSSIAKLDGEALQNIPISTVGEGLKGKIARSESHADQFLARRRILQPDPRRFVDQRLELPAGARRRCRTRLLGHQPQRHRLDRRTERRGLVGNLRREGLERNHPRNHQARRL